MCMWFLLQCVYCTHSRRHFRIFKKFARMVNFFAGFSFVYAALLWVCVYAKYCNNDDGDDGDGGSMWRRRRQHSALMSMQF